MVDLIFAECVAIEHLLVSQDKLIENVKCNITVGIQFYNFQI